MYQDPHLRVLTGYPHQGDPLEETWVTGDFVQVTGVYVDQHGHSMKFTEGEQFGSSAVTGGQAHRRLIIIISTS